jgi:hypothetical protein
MRIMVLDELGAVQARLHFPVHGPRTPVQLTGFPRGHTFLICAFAGDEMVWSTPVTSG